MHCQSDEVCIARLPRDTLSDHIYLHAGIQKIGLLNCSDGVKAYQRGPTSLTLSEFSILSLAPDQRYRPENMIIHMMHPSELKSSRLNKYYDFAVQDELHELYYNGLQGTRIKSVFVFGITLDLEGRYKFFRMQNYNAFYACTICKHRFAKGLGRRVVFTGTVYV